MILFILNTQNRQIDRTEHRLEAQTEHRLEAQTRSRGVGERLEVSSPDGKNGLWC